ncbi:hypothetical protein QBC41DRAFT_394168 [Cercophora samala]|uniref:RING-type domain-containing protein n=1 Tax=Cercophora samala TaxID=330535 RepID=A0AA39ZLR2_9PEZI|nr:hypothetical protein QBC41DRAFT_394168 [Cercophora samala]
MANDLNQLPYHYLSPDEIHSLLPVPASSRGGEQTRKLRTWLTDISNGAISTITRPIEHMTTESLDTVDDDIDTAEYRIEVLDHATDRVALALTATTIAGCLCVVGHAARNSIADFDFDLHTRVSAKSGKMVWEAVEQARVATEDLFSLAACLAPRAADEEEDKPLPPHRAELVDERGPEFADMMLVLELELDGWLRPQRPGPEPMLLKECRREHCGGMWELGKRRLMAAWLAQILHIRFEWVGLNHGTNDHDNDELHELDEFEDPDDFYLDLVDSEFISHLYQNRDLGQNFWEDNSYRDTTINCVICRETIDDDNDNPWLDQSKKDKTDEEKQPVSLPTCGHWFHRSCVAPWVERNKSCPLCRRALSGVEECIKRQDELTSKIVEMKEQGKELVTSPMFRAIVEASTTAPTLGESSATIKDGQRPISPARER